MNVKGKSNNVRGVLGGKLEPVRIFRFSSFTLLLSHRLGMFLMLCGLRFLSVFSFGNFATSHRLPTCSRLIYRCRRHASLLNRFNPIYFLRLFISHPSSLFTFHSENPPDFSEKKNFQFSLPFFLSSSLFLGKAPIQPQKKRFGTVAFRKCPKDCFHSSFPFAVVTSLSASLHCIIHFRYYS